MKYRTTRRYIPEDSPLQASICFLTFPVLMNIAGFWLNAEVLYEYVWNTWKIYNKIYVSKYINLS
jgi:hypothetical protein